MCAMHQAEGHIVVVYDVRDDKRRYLLHKLLCDFGTPVQDSVFECALSGKQFTRMQGLVARIIQPADDLVRYYPLCDRCRARIQAIPAVTGRSSTVQVV